MRFLIDAHQLGLRQTGNETWSRNVVRMLHAAIPGHELHVAVTESGLQSLPGLSDAQHHVVSANALRRLTIDLPRIVAREGVDAVLGQYTVLPSRAASVVMVHDLSPLDPRAAAWMGVRFRARFRASIEVSVRVASLVLTPSQFTRRQIIEAFSLQPDRVRVAPNAVDDELARLLDATPRVLPAITTVLSVGNVLPRKNLEIVAGAVRRLQLSGTRIRYRVVGSVNRDGRATEHQLRRILPDVEVVGYTSTLALAKEYRSASMLAFPSLFEGFGIPAIEAMRARLPVICSDAAALPETGGDGCVVIRAGDIDAWVAAIQLLSTDTAAARRLRRLGHARARQFDWTSTARVVADTLVTAGAWHRLKVAARAPHPRRSTRSSTIS